MPGENSLNRRICETSGRSELSSGVRSEIRNVVTEGAISIALQPRGRSFNRVQDLHVWWLHRAEPLPAFEMLRLRHCDGPVGNDRGAIASTWRDVGYRAGR